MTRKERKSFKIRLCCVAGFFLLFLIVLAGRGFQLQIMKNDLFKKEAESQQCVAVTVPSERGLILDQNGEKLAATVLADSVYVDPKMVTNRDAVAVKLSSMLGMRKADVMKKLSGPKRFNWIKRKVTPTEAEAVRTLAKEGVYLLQEPNRFYPQMDRACHILGFVNIDSEGLEGLESRYNDKLKGPLQAVSWRIDAKRNRIYRSDQPIHDTHDDACNIILTIDSRIQFIAEQQLKEAVEANRAKGGSAIVMDPRTGEILAMANYPSYNPNVFNQSAPDNRRNRSLTDCFDPGSVFKPFVAAAALEEGVVTEHETFYCENGAYAVGDRVIHEAHMKRHQSMTLADIIKVSSNIGIAKVAERLGKERFHEYLKKFGFGDKTGIDMTGEVAGFVRQPGSWRPIDFANMAFGQGISVTALQLVTALSAIANDGVMMRPHVVRGLVNRDGRVIEEFTPQVVRKVISPATADRIAALMTDVVQGEGGTGARARIEGVSVAGKTGTAQKFDKVEKAYSSQKVTASFMGFLPAEDPQMVILVVIDEPATNRWGGVAAAPIFKNISEQVLCRFDKNIEIKEVARKGKTVAPATPLDIESDIVDIIPASAVESAASFDPEGRSLTPDFTGMSVRDALRLCSERGMTAKITGSGWAVTQQPAPGIAIDTNQPCFIFFARGF